MVLTKNCKKLKAIILKVLNCFGCSIMHIICSKSMIFQFQICLKWPLVFPNTNHHRISMVLQTILILYATSLASTLVISVFTSAIVLEGSWYSISSKYYHKNKDRCQIRWVKSPQKWVSSLHRTVRVLLIQLLTH